MVLKGRAWKFGDDINTNVIIQGRYGHLRTNLPELAKHAMEDIRPEFAANVRPGDMVVAGSNMGLGSSREYAPLVLKHLEVSAVIAKSFARIFYRNCINQGLPAIRVDTDRIHEGDELELDLEQGTLKNQSTQETLAFPQLSKAMAVILRDGGLVAHVRAHNGLCLPLDDEQGLNASA